MLDAATLREIAVAAGADPRSIAKVIRGEPVRGMVRARIVRELVARGISFVAPATPIGMSFAGEALAMAGGRGGPR